VDREVSKLSQNNKRLALDIKSVKEDSQFVIARLQHLSKVFPTQRTSSTTRRTCRRK